MFPRHRLSLLLLALISVVALSGFGCRRTVSNTDSGSELVVWGLWQESAMMQPVIDAFQKTYGGKVVYKKIASVNDYEQELVKALAEGRGPDVFVIHHTWVNDKKRLLSPAPPNIIDERAVRDEFVDVVANDLVEEGQVYALPTSVDTLAMFYNRDLLNAAGVPRPPRTWTEFQNMVAAVSRLSRSGAIEQSAAALGTAVNINRAPDIVQLLMMQSGLSIVDQKTGESDINNDIGRRVLTFYTDFSNKSKRVYTWNLQEDYSLDAFAEGRTAAMFNYSYHLATIRAKNPNLNFAVAAMPQIDDSNSGQRLNFAAYWPFAVAAASKSPEQAWQFTRFLTNHDNATSINAAQKVPPARRDSVVQLQRDTELGVYADQVLTARSWRRPDIAATDTIFNNLVDSVVTGAATINDALNRAQDQLNQLTSPSNAGS